MDKQINMSKRSHKKSSQFYIIMDKMTYNRNYVKWFRIKWNKTKRKKTKQNKIEEGKIK